MYDIVGLWVYETSVIGAGGRRIGSGVGAGGVLVHDFDSCLSFVLCVVFVLTSLR